MDKDLNKTKEEIIAEIDREFNISLARLNKIYQDFISLVKNFNEEKDKSRLEKLRKDILNK